MGKAILIRFADAADDVVEATASIFRYDLAHGAHLDAAVDVIGWPPIPEQIAELTDT